jgi:Cu/Ag efflux pump CusA
VVAIGGLIVGTFLTLLIVPVRLYLLLRRRYPDTQPGEGTASIA